MLTKVRTTLHSDQQWTRAFIRVKVKVVPRNYKKEEKQNGFCIYQKCGKFRSILLAHFIKYKPLIKKSGYKNSNAKLHWRKMYCTD